VEDFSDVWGEDEGVDADLEREARDQAIEEERLWNLGYREGTSVGWRRRGRERWMGTLRTGAGSRWGRRPGRRWGGRGGCTRR